MGSEQFEWREPTEEELREIQERRNRSDLISKIMSDYLLKGYRMLDSYCTDCGNAMLDNKKGRIFCVGCEEIDKKQQQPEMENISLKTSGVCAAAAAEIYPVSASTSEKPQKANEQLKKLEIKTDIIVLDSIDAVVDSIKMATEKLRASKSPNECAEYANLIRCCADALCSLKRIK